MQKKEKKNENKKIIGWSIVTGLILIVLIAGIVYFYSENKKKEEELILPYTELIQAISDNKVEKIEMTSGSNSVSVKLREEETEKTSSVPNLQAFTEYIQKKVEEGTAIELVQKQPNIILRIGEMIITFLPTILLVALFILLYKMQGLGDKGKVYDDQENKSKVTFDDVAGLDEEKAELVEIVDFLKNPEEFHKMGARVPRGVLLCGKPGTGKTLIAKAIAGEAKVPFISMSGSEFIEMFAGLGASRVRKLFEKAKKIAPCIIFIDEIDAIGSRRTSNSGAESENNQTLNQLLVEMDGFESDQNIIVLAATNRPEMLDKALLRPGRFDRQIMIATPDQRGREEILKIHSKEKKFSQEVSLQDIAEDTAGFTGAELENVLNEAAIIATVNKHEAITRKDIEDAVKKVTMGLEKHNRKISEKDKKLTAYHEAGHAVVSQFLETQNNVKEVSIIPRGVAGGYTMYRTNEDKFYISKTEMEEKLVALLGGRAAEKLVLDDISTGASNDLEVATKIAKDMVTVYGMSDTLGPISLKSLEENQADIFLYGQKMEDVIGAEIKILMDTAYTRAQKILQEHREVLDKIAQTLLEKEIISAEEFKKFFE